MKILITGGSGFIGTNLIQYLLDQHNKYEIINLDINIPKNNQQNQYWKKCDIKDKKSVLVLFNEFKPDCIIHLAAKASLKGKTLDDFPDNIIGTQNIVDCIKQTSSIKKFIHTSTQYVNTPGVHPKSETDFSPYTVYGLSKVKSEKIVRNANLDCEWFIIRPTNIWGPWHSVFPYELWPYLSKRFYFHPGFSPINKYYGFIGNSVCQIEKLLYIKDKSLMNQVYYITDPPIDNAEWMNSFSVALSGYNIRKIPKFLWKIFALSGDFLNSIGLKVPLDSERYFRLTVNEALPYKKSIELTGGPHYNLTQGISLCMDWIKKYFPDLIRVTK